MHRICLAVVLLLPLSAVAHGGTPSPEKLIEQLADKNFKVRQAAAKAIEDLGPAALPALRKAREHPDLDVRRRIEKWIPEFELLEIVAPKKVTLKAHRGWAAVLASLADRPLRVSDVTIHGNMDCFKIETPAATYIYGKKGAGFASILDKDGRDWISYRPGGKAKGEYHGLPKCGQPTKFFHCGYGYGQYKTDNVFVSKATVIEAAHIRIESETLDKKSACTWDFYPTHATLTLLRIDAPTFWFLYEGTPGGEFHPDKDFVIRPDGRKSSLSEPWSQVVPWVCFGTGDSSVGFVCINHQKPEKGETDSYVAWPFVKEADGSFQDMTVFGFGRKGYKELIKHIPDLTGLPARYSIGFIDKADYATAKAFYDRLH